MTPHDPSHRHEKVHFHQKKRHLDVVADPADLSTAVETFMHGGARKRFLDDLMQSPQFNATVDEWMRRLLAETADHLGIKTPLPKMPPTQ